MVAITAHEKILGFQYNRTSPIVPLTIIIRGVKIKNDGKNEQKKIKKGRVFSPALRVSRSSLSLGYADELDECCIDRDGIV